MYRAAILVLLYNKKIFNSETIRTLISSDVSLKETLLIVWNNGPNSVSFDDAMSLGCLGCDVILQETLDNESLSVIYNIFVTNYMAKKYVILDDDSSLNPEYILGAMKIGRNEVGMPIIKMNEKIQSPIVNNQPYRPGQRIDCESKLISIGSGLIIGDEVLSKLRCTYGDKVFDERFFLYGVDTTFCLRLYLSNLTKSIVFTNGFNHSLSRLENEDDNKVNFRRLERAYDEGLQLRYYSGFIKGLYVIFRIGVNNIVRVLRGRDKKLDYRHLVKAFFTGKHYRC